MTDYLADDLVTRFFLPPSNLQTESGLTEFNDILVRREESYIHKEPRK